MIKNYLEIRSGSVKFFVLAILFSLFVTDRESNGFKWGYNILFLYISFMIFRFIDDAGSRAIDRMEHPERTYLRAPYYPIFLQFTIVLSIVYLIATLLIDLRTFYILTTLIAISSGLYVLFPKRKSLLQLVPLLKYPVLLWCLEFFTTDLNETAPLIAAFFIIFTHDMLEKAQEGKRNLLWVILPLVLSGLLVSRPWIDPADGWLILPVLILTLVFRHLANVRYLPILYFPILAFLLNIN